MTPIKLNYEDTLEQCIIKLESSDLDISFAFFKHAQEDKDGIILWFSEPNEYDEDDTEDDCE